MSLAFPLKLKDAPKGKIQIIINIECQNKLKFDEKIKFIEDFFII